MANTVTSGFCKYGNFVWVNEGDRERCINLALIEAATFRKSDFLEPPWSVHVMTSVSGWEFTFGTEAEARTFLGIVVGDDSGLVPFSPQSSASTGASK